MYTKTACCNLGLCNGGSVDASNKGPLKKQKVETMPAAPVNCGGRQRDSSQNVMTPLPGGPFR